MNKRGNIVLGNDYDSWYDYGIKEPITSDITPKTNTHCKRKIIRRIVLP